MNHSPLWLKKINRAFFTTPFHPFLLAAFFILKNLRDIDYFVSGKELIFPVIVLLTSVMTLFLLLKLLLRLTSSQAGIPLFILFVFLLFYDDFYFLINSPSVINIRNRNLTGIFLMIWGASVFLIGYFKPRLSRINHYLNLLMILICIGELGIFLDYQWQGPPWSRYTSTERKLFKGSEVPEGKGRELPDIYFIIADAYTSNKALKEIWNYDNYQFSDSLKGMGFYVADNAKSNYRLTPLSLASILNMDYLPDYQGALKNENSLHILSMASINDNDLMRQLQKKGYRSKNYSMFRFNGEPPVYVIDYISCPNFMLLPEILLSKTVFYWAYIYNKIMYSPGLIVNMQDSLINVSRQKNKKNPVFVYAHFPIPHSPFYFDKSGRPPGSYKNSMEAYLEQLQYTNNILLGLAARIKKNTQGKAIILLQGDHGSRFASASGGRETEDYSALSACYFPSGNYKLLHDSLSAVNLFRIVLNSNFGEQYPLFEDKQGFRKK